jgi:hypothetical protein
MLFDAPNANAINQLMVEIQAFLWNTVLVPQEAHARVSTLTLSKEYGMYFGFLG